MRLILTCAGIVGLFVVTYLIWGEYFEQLLAGDKARAWLESFGPWAWAIAILLMVTDVLLPIPATAVLAMLGLIYGPLVGGLIGCVGSYLAGAVGYLICRAMGDRAARFLMGDRMMERSRRFFTSSGGWLVALSRWMIILPELVSCLAGLTRMPAGRYFTALACGTIPMCFTYAWIGQAGSDRPILALALSAAVPVFLWPAAQWFLQKRAVKDSDPPGVVE